ncbi:type II secretion system protein [Stenotrophomonas acidaminiphila]
MFSFLINSTIIKKGLDMHKKGKGFGLTELILSLTIGMAAVGFIVHTYQGASVQASVRSEQKQVGLIVENLEASFQMAPNYTGISANDITSPAVNKRGGQIKSSMGESMTVSSADVRFMDDAFDLTYTGLSKKECIGIVPALYNRAYNVFIQNKPTIVLDGKLLDEGAIVTQCANNSTVRFRFFREKNNFAASVMPDDFATPPTTPPTVTPPTVVNPTTPPTPVTPGGVGSVCVPEVQTVVNNCPAGQVGAVMQRRQRDCSGVWSSWANVSSSCVPAPTVAACLPQTQRQPVACPSGQGGQEIQERTSSCDASGVTTWGNWKLISSTCTAACVALGNCCVPSSRTQTISQPCAIGSYGSVSALQKQSSICSSSTATPMWGTPWQNVTTNGSCAACPADSVTYTTRWVDITNACLIGSYGSNVQQQEQRQGTLVAYNCNASAGQTTATPTTTVNPWQVTGTTRVVSSCAACPANTSNVETQWVGLSGACPAGQTGTQTWEAQQQRTVSTTYNCNSAGGQTTSVPSTTATAWADNGATRNVNTSACVTIPVTPPTHDFSGITASCLVKGSGAGDWSDSDDKKMKDGVKLTCVARCSNSSASVNNCKGAGPDSTHTFRLLPFDTSVYSVQWTSDCAGETSNRCTVKRTKLNDPVRVDFTVTHIPTGATATGSIRGEYDPDIK